MQMRVGGEPTLRWLSDAAVIHHCGWGCTLCCPQLYLMKPPSCKWACPFSFLFFPSLSVQAASGRRNPAETHNRDSQIMYGWRAPCVQNREEPICFYASSGRPRWSTETKVFLFKAVRKEMQKKMLTHKLAQMFINDFKRWSDWGPQNVETTLMWWQFIPF